jgi:hypothetical protein
VAAVRAPAIFAAVYALAVYGPRFICARLGPLYTRALYTGSLYGLAGTPLYMGSLYTARCSIRARMRARCIRAPLYMDRSGYGPRYIRARYERRRCTWARCIRAKPLCCGSYTEPLRPASALDRQRGRPNWLRFVITNPSLGLVKAIAVIWLSVGLSLVAKLSRIPTKPIWHSLATV